MNNRIPMNRFQGGRRSSPVVIARTPVMRGCTCPACIPVYLKLNPFSKKTEIIKRKNKRLIKRSEAYEQN